MGCGYPAPGLKVWIDMKNEIIWRPHGDYVTKSNLRRFMDRCGAGDYQELLARSVRDSEWFWDASMKDLGVEWYEPYTRVLDSSRGFPWCRWFESGKINLVHNCLDRHSSSRRDQLALIWEGDGGETREMTYGELDAAVCRMANAMRDRGVGTGDSVGIYMPMLPETVVALLAVWKIGSIAVPIFSGFGPDAVAVRLRDAGAKLLFTADASVRRGKPLQLKELADQALRSAPSVKTCVVFRRTGASVSWQAGRDAWWDELVESYPSRAPTERLNSEDLCLNIYTSGTTGRPKGTLHTHGGVIAQVPRELAYFMDVQERDRFFWLTDLGWMMGPWEIIGVTFLGATVFLFEGAPNWPNPDRLWQIVERHRLTHLGISPTAIRLLLRAGEQWVDRHDLSSLRILGSTGEPWDPESYLWYFRKAGGERCPVINISGGSELMGCLVACTPLAPLKPCSFQGPGLGMDVDVCDEDGKPVRGAVGYLVCKKPAPSMTRGFLNDPQRYLETYFSRWPGTWYHGDWARVDEDGFWYILGRADDTIKVAGKRTGPAEIEAALISHPAVSEAAAIGVPDEVRGETVVCFVVLKPGFETADALTGQLSDKVVESLGKTLRPRKVYIVSALPKTRSAKIVRGAIKRRYLGQDPGDLSSVENPEALDAIPSLFPTT